MIILGIDTSAAVSAALVEVEEAVKVEDSSGAHAGVEVLGEFTQYRSRRHTELLGEAIRELLHVEDHVDLVVTGVGPGPFTGLRAGIATGIGFAAGRGIEVHGVPSHEALAHGYLASHSASPSAGTPVWVATDARRKEVYYTAFDGVDAYGIPTSAHGPDVAAPADLGHVDAVRLGRGFELYAEVLGAPVSTEERTLEPTATDVAKLAAAYLRAGRELPSTSPLYLRAPDAKPGPVQPQLFS